MGHSGVQEEIWNYHHTFFSSCVAFIPIVGDHPGCMLLFQGSIERPQATEQSILLNSDFCDSIHSQCIYSEKYPSFLLFSSYCQTTLDCRRFLLTSIISVWATFFLEFCSILQSTVRCWFTFIVSLLGFYLKPFT